MRKKRHQTLLMRNKPSLRRK